MKAIFIIQESHMVPTQMTYIQMVGIRKINVHEHRLPTTCHDFLVEHFPQKILQLLEIAVVVNPSSVANLLA